MSDEQRRLGAIMLTDIVGYTSLTQSNEDLALKLLSEHNKIVRKIYPEFKGTEIKTIGDAFLLMFESAKAAVNCAVKIQGKIKSRNKNKKDENIFNIRIGIHIGDVIHKEGDVFGDGVNITSRIEPLAEPGGICISEQVYYQIKNKIDLPIESIGEYKLKNIETPLNVYKIILPNQPTESTSKKKAAKLISIPKITNIKTRKRVRNSNIIAIILLTAFSAYWYFTEHKSKPERIPIAVIDFVNETDDQELDGLSGMLITSLEQSRRLSVLTRASMFDILKVLDRELPDRIDEELGKVICEKAKVNIMALATIKKFGNVYNIDLKLMDPQKNTYLFSMSEKGEGLENVPYMIDLLAEKTRNGLDEELEEINLNNRKIVEVTTPNLEAYQHYFKGEEFINKLQFVDAEKEFRKAVEIDSTFGLAWYRLSYSIGWNKDLFDTEDRIEKDTMKKAIRYLDRIPEKEKFLVKAYSVFLENKDSLGVAILYTMKKKYPKDKEMLFELADAYFHMGPSMADSAIYYFNSIIDIDPKFARAYDHLLDLYFFSKEDDFEIRLKMAKILINILPSYSGYFYLVDALANLGQAEQALGYLKNLEKLNYDKYAIHLLYGLIYFHIEELDKAELEIKKAFQNNLRTKRYLEKLFGLGESIYRAKHDSIQVVFQQTVLEVDPNNFLALIALDAALSRLGKGKEREILLRKIENDDSLSNRYGKSYLFSSLGWSLMNQRKFTEADIYFRNGYNQDSTNRSSLNGLISLNLRFKDYKGARLFIIKYANQSPERTSFAEYHFGRLSLLENDFNLAIKHLEKAHKYDSTATRAKTLLGYSYISNTDYIKAENIMTTISIKDSTFATTNFKAWLLVKGNIDLDKGISLAQQALKAKPQFFDEDCKVFTYRPLPEHTIGLAFLKKGDSKQAIEYLKKASAILPERQSIKDDLRLAIELKKKK